jgi:hypothetical protein
MFNVYGIAELLTVVDVPDVVDAGTASLTHSRASVDVVVDVPVVVLVANGTTLGAKLRTGRLVVGSVVGRLASVAGVVHHDVPVAVGVLIPISPVELFPLVPPPASSDPSIVYGMDLLAPRADDQIRAMFSVAGSRKIAGAKSSLFEAAAETSP